ncbi:MAG: aminopeptidase [Acidimicrobiales bacterium]|nr:aminopeptidase [Acidimicrobiales bacterium]
MNRHDRSAGLAAGAAALVSSYAGVGAADHLTIVRSDLTADGHVAVDAIRTAARRLGVRVTDVVQAGTDPRRVLADSDAVLIAADNESPWRGPIVSALADGVRCRVLRMFGTSTALVANGLRMDQTTMARLNANVLETMRSSSVINVTSSSGTDLTIRPLANGTWASSCGHFDGRRPAVLPPGEVNTYTPHVDGVLVADGAVNTSFGFPGSAVLDERPIHVTIANGVVVDAACSDRIVSMVLRDFFEVPNADRVGEVGFGTNIGLRAFIPKLCHLNERWPGIHLGLGSPTQLVDWSCPLHLDLIPADVQIVADGQPVFSNGRYHGLRDCDPEESRIDLHVDAV